MGRHRERRHGVLPLAGDPDPLLRGGQHLDPAGTGQHRGECGPEAGHRLTAVDDEQHRPVAQLPDQPLEGAPTGPAAGPEPGRDQGDRRLRRAGAEQVDGDHAVREPVRDLPRQRGGEARLAHTRWPGQRQQPAPGRQQGRAECRELVGTPQECGVDHASS